jgi:hypothetical protein
LVNGFQDWSWAPHNLANTTPVHSGSNSISVTASAYQAVWLYQSGFSTGSYSNLVFWAHGGPGGGQKLQVRAVVNGTAGPTYSAQALQAGVWLQFSVPFSALGASSQTNVQGFWIVLAPGPAGIFYLDDIQIGPAPPPALVNIAVQDALVQRTVDARMFGLNTAVWDSYLGTPETLELLRELGCGALRFPGGSLSDEYHWGSNTTGANTWTWASSFSQFAAVATNVGAQTVITVNYGTGSAAEAADWVRSANVTNHFGFKYWEIGNEVYGTWETDSNSLPHDSFTYTTRAVGYIAQMKAVDPSIKIGVVAATGASNYINGYKLHPAVNLRTGVTNYGWTPVLLSALRQAGVTPDFLIYHWYPEYTGQESDPFVLQSSAEWSVAAADLRQQINDYFGPGGTNIELLCTENNSESGAQGKQSTSLVNALYLADNFGRILSTEFKSYIWWDLRNGTDTTGNMDPTLYGWRTNGDLGMVNGLTNTYPDFYGMKLMTEFARPGDEVLAVTSDYLLLSAYGVRHSDGSVGLLVINKDSAATFGAQITLGGFKPATAAGQYSYGIPQDDAAETGVGSTDLASSSFANVSGSFTGSFPPLSLTVLTLNPAPPWLSSLGAAPMAGQFGVRLQGQSGVSYVIETSTDLFSWSPILTNAPGGQAVDLEFPVESGSTRQFWRGRWLP